MGLQTTRQYGYPRVSTATVSCAGSLMQGLSLVQTFELVACHQQNNGLFLRMHGFCPADSRMVNPDGIIPNTAVFGPTKLIETTTTTASTARLKISKFRFLNLDF